MVLPVNRELYWFCLNNSFANIPINPGNIFDIMPNYVDIAPVLVQPQGKSLVTITVKIQDNGKASFKITEGAPAVYYVPISTVGLVEYMMQLLPTQEFHRFYDQLRLNILAYKNGLKSITPHTFGLNELPLLQGSQSNGNMTRTQVSPLAQVSNQGGMNSFCPSCGAQITATGSGQKPKFCSTCGSNL